MAAFGQNFLVDHSLGFVATALVVCAIMAAIVLTVLDRASSVEGGRRYKWMAVSAAVAGLGVWTTHFVAMLGFRPDVILGYDPMVTIVSVFVGILFVGLPLAATVLVHSRAARMALGAIAGLGVGAMHFTGMSALQGCLAAYDPLVTLISLFAGAGFFAAAMSMKPRGKQRLAVAALMVLGVCFLHFIAIAGLTLSAAPAAEVWIVEPVTLSAFVALAALMIFITAFILAVNGEKLDASSRAAAADAAEHLRVLSAALQNMSNGLVMVGPDGIITLHNERAYELLGIGPNELRSGLALSSFLDNFGHKAGWDAARIDRVIDNHTVWMRRSTITRVEHHLADGRVIGVACCPMADGGAILTYDDMTEARQVQATITHMAYHDALTGLPNRRSFQDELKARFDSAKPTTIVMIDLDRFKAVNDTLGHPVGDALLIQVADRLRACCDPNDLIFRLGGDELAILPGDDEHSDTLARRVVEGFERPFTADKHRISIGCSVGLATADDVDDPDLVVRQADLALYKAKKNGRNRIERYESGMMEDAVKRRDLEMDMVRALKEGQFSLNYQPLFNLPTRELVGFEALIRWTHPTLGLISPVDFIPLAEETGLITEIGEWVLNEACREASRWPGELYVSVNVSPVQLHKTDMLRQVTRALAEHGLTAQRLELELTETAMVDDGRRINATLTALRSLGVRIAMDDFGTGYSSLAHLREFDLDRIKIDRSFIDSAPDDVSSLAVLRAVTMMAKDLSIATTGEGVESEEQLARLLDLGCGTAQGYLLGRPMTAEAARALMQTTDAIQQAVAGIAPGELARA
ncbi:MAG: EAL domain-containing protein [Aurantimonas coralicida]|uniref:EAL domain-containing protein n=1 Tax=Aurantimonas coralicida TaxID=182270 RepID=UPI001D185FD2|nr:EAL domain-containing protein [Aurantimonas coralicida]MCC4296763.1 EAL domain-containing protein [Aurantimonas coralicida]MDE0924733.1 EAL domain-containing protein [Aurantimonas coralicida]